MIPIIRKSSDYPFEKLENLLRGFKYVLLDTHTNDKTLTISNEENTITWKGVIDGFETEVFLQDFKYAVDPLKTLEDELLDNFCEYLNNHYSIIDGKTLTIELYYTPFCPHCKDMISLIDKTAFALHGKFKVTNFNLRDFNRPEIEAVPTFFINVKKYVGSLPPNIFYDEVLRELLWSSV